jgi:hypothetical protein
MKSKKSIPKKKKVKVVPKKAAAATKKKAPGKKKAVKKKAAPKKKKALPKKKSPLKKKAPSKKKIPQKKKAPVKKINTNNTGEEKIPTPLAQGFLYTGVAIREHDLIYISIMSPYFQKKQLPYVAFYDYDITNAPDLQLLDDRRWDSAGICVTEKPKAQMVSVGVGGQVFVIGSGEDFDERVTHEQVHLRSVRAIQGIAYACGMDRKVYKREEAHYWTPIHTEELLQAPAPDIVFGFESIHGFAQDEVYAVGWHGEIWYYDGETWTAQASPTRYILTKVLCAPDGFVYVCGQAGMLIKGKDNNWEIIQGGPQVDFWDLAWYNDMLHISTLSEVFTFSNSTFEPVDFGDDPPASCHYLSANCGLLWSVGETDAMQFDGEQWTRIE